LLAGGYKVGLDRRLALRHPTYSTNHCLLLCSIHWLLGELCGLPLRAKAWPQPQATEVMPSNPGSLRGCADSAMPVPCPSCPRLLVPQLHTQPCASMAKLATPDAAAPITCTKSQDFITLLILAVDWTIKCRHASPRIRSGNSGRFSE